MKRSEALKQFLLRLIFWACVVLVYIAVKKPYWNSLSTVCVAALGVIESAVHAWRYTVTGRYMHRQDEVYGLVMAAVFIAIGAIAFLVYPR